MATASESEVLAKLMRPLSRDLSADLAGALVTLRADDETQARYDELGRKERSRHAVV